MYDVAKLLENKNQTNQKGEMITFQHINKTDS